MRLLEDRSVIVTGAAGGIGSLVSAQLRESGAYIVGVDRSEANNCQETVFADLASERGVEALCEVLRTRRCDILVNLAGVQYFGPFAAQAPATIWRDYAVNLIAPTMLAHAVVPGMIAQGSGRIVNIGSVLGCIPFAHLVTYSSGKAGLKAFSDALRRELVGTGVSVTHIAPRAVRTALVSDKMLAFAKASRMTMDEPIAVAGKITAAIMSEARDVVIGTPESWFIRINALAPGLIDRALASGDRKAAALFR